MKEYELASPDLPKASTSGFELIPAIDVLDGAVVRLERGDYEAVTVYRDDPVAVANEFVAAGASLVHVVDLEGARSGVPDVALRRRFGDSGVPFQIGGGLRTVDEIVGAIADGARRAVAGTIAVWNEAELAAMVAAVGAEKVVAAIDVSGGRARGGGWLDDGRPVADVVAGLQRVGVVRALVTAISRDGMMSGPDLDLLATVAASGLQVIASGGVGTVDDLTDLARQDLSGAIVGRAIYEGRFTVAEAVAAVS